MSPAARSAESFPGPLRLPPHWTAAAAAKSPACANPAIITMSPAPIWPSATAASKLTGMPTANRLPHSWNVSRWRSGEIPSASFQLRSSSRLGWLVTSRSRSLGLHPDAVAHRTHDLGHLTVAAGEHLDDLGLVEADIAFTRAGLPPPPRRIGGQGHVGGILTVVAALDVEHRRRVRQRDQAYRCAVAGNRRLGQLANLLLLEDLAGGVLRDRDQRGAPGAAGQ